MERLLDPKNDWAFKQLFGQEKNKKILISFLNAMLEGVESLVVDVEFLKVETDTEIQALRQSIVDVLCKAEDGRRFIVEMQSSSDSSFIQRAVEYASRVYLNQRTRAAKERHDGGGRKAVCPVIFLAVVEKKLFKDIEGYLTHHRIQEVVTGRCEIREMSFSFLELSKFDKGFDELESDVDRWAYFFKHADMVSPERLREIFESKTIFGEAYKELERSGYSPEQLLEYVRYELKEEEIQTRITDATLKGEKKGRAEGEKKGRAEGEKKGRAEGEKKAKTETARNLLLMGLGDSQISQATGLSIDEIRSLGKT